MARIAGVDLPRDKRVEIGLTYILGIGLSSSQEILKKTGVNPDTRVRDLTEDEVQKIREVIGSDYKVEGDLRRDFSMSLGYYDNRKNNEWVESRYVCKFMDVPYQNNDASNNYPVIRYADVILMYAEALNQNGKTAEACKYLNMTRRRGFGYQTTETSPVDLQTTDKAQFALMVEQERRVELAFENHRWFDLIRTGRAVEVMRSKGFSLNETNLICPIPQKQIDVNPKLTQNDYRIESRN